MSRGRCMAIGCSLLSLFASAAGAEGRLVLSTVPSGLDAWGNSRYLGRTPLVAEISPGATLLRVAEVSGSDLWSAPALDTLLHVAEGETLRLALRIGRGFSIRTVPSGLAVMRGMAKIGETPLDLRLFPEDLGQLWLETPKGVVRVPPDTLLARGFWTWSGGRTAIAPSPKPGRSLLRRLGRYGAPVLACGLAVGATAAERAADRSYEKYRSSADPARIEKYYNEARDRDALSTGLWVGAEISLATMILSWIFPDGPETAPGAGVIGGDR